MSQKEDQILLHEPLWEVPCSRPKTMETLPADHQNCHYNYPGSHPRCDLNRCLLCCSTILVTNNLFSPSSQLVSFGLSNQMVVTFKEENLMTFKHLFLKDYVDGGMDTYAVYRQADVYGHIDYIIRQVTECCHCLLFILFPPQPWKACSCWSCDTVYL